MHLILVSLGFPFWLRLSHYINLLFIGLLIRSGIEILGAHPRLYWNDGCTPKTEWIKFTKKKVPIDPGVIYTARDDEIGITPLLALPGKKNLIAVSHFPRQATSSLPRTGWISSAMEVNHASPFMR